MILNKVHTNVEVAFAQEEHQARGVWPPAHVPSETRVVRYTQQEGPGVVSCTMGCLSFPLKRKVKSLPLYPRQMQTILRGVQISLDS